MYCVDGEDVYLEMLTADEARTVLQGLHAQVAAHTTQDRALDGQIDEVTTWLDVIADTAEAAADHAADIHAEQLAGNI